MISAHSHLTNLFQRGFPDETSFEAWLSKANATEGLLNLSPGEIYTLHCAACLGFLRHGVTTVLNMFALRSGQRTEQIQWASKAFLDTG